MVAQPRTAPSVSYWPDRVRVVFRFLARSAREIWSGLDTWSGITHGSIPMNGDLPEQLAARGDLDGLAALADAGDEYASTLLTRAVSDRVDASAGELGAR
ncbi:hypothetical protein BJF90_28265 [Pseudonocardia sp. CNS-004]|nr:hypothetical protein BJF90_28265 [Pseudonocardia sp. CNS-004]